MDAAGLYQPPGWAPNEYQQALLDRLGELDAADVQASTPMALRELIAQAEGDIRTRPAPGEWSVLQCVAHICDAEIVVAARYRFSLAQDAPDMPGYDQDRWVDRFHDDGAADDPAEMLALFDALRAANLALWRATPEADRWRCGVHLERGPESYGLQFRLYAGHELVHMDQARRTLEQVRAAG